MLNLNPAETAVMQLAAKTNYLNKDITYLRNIQITEYDIHAAGFTAISSKKLLPEEELKRISELPKDQRNIAIGLHIRKNPELEQAIQKGLMKARQAFALVNRLESRNILSIKKDAIFVIKQNPQILKIKDFEFVKKGAYTSYALLNGKEFYYGKEGLTIKGIGDEEYLRGKNGFIKELELLFKTAETNTAENIFKILKMFHQKYLGRRFRPDVYRQLETGLFKINQYEMAQISPEDVDLIEIENNFIKYFLPLARCMF